MNLKKYLFRIGVENASAQPTEGTLFRLQQQHLLNVPFENLDVHLGNSISLNIPSLYHKIVEKGRGGFCYELNGLFHQLLKSLGYEAKLISCRVHIDDNKYSPEFDHMAIIVELGDRQYLVDVGFGSFSFSPLPIQFNVKISDAFGTFAFNNHPSKKFIKVSQLKHGKMIPAYIFKTESRTLSQFFDMCDFHQNSPNSHVRKKKMISKALRNGRITLTESHLIISKEGNKSKREINPKHFDSYLKEHFQINLH